jgi:hypothetical protein
LYAKVVLNLYVRPEKPVVSYLTALTGLTAGVVQQHGRPLAEQVGLHRARGDGGDGALGPAGRPRTPRPRPFLRCLLRRPLRFAWAPPGNALTLLATLFPCFEFAF